MNQDVPFPAPFKGSNGGRNHWRKGDIRRWKAAMAGLPNPPPQSDDDHWMTSRQLRDELGGVSHMWLYRRYATRVMSPNEAA